MKDKKNILIIEEQKELKALYNILSAYEGKKYIDICNSILERLAFILS